jgi:hypothetical protein
VSAPQEEDIRATIVRYAMLVDDGRFDEWAELFTPEARFHVMGATTVGREAIQAFITEALPPERRGKHLCGVPLIDVDSWNGTARVWTDFVFVDQSGAITQDVMERGGDKVWRYAVHEIVFRAKAPELTDPPPAVPPA